MLTKNKEVFSVCYVKMRQKLQLLLKGLKIFRVVKMYKGFFFNTSEIILKYSTTKV